MFKSQSLKALENYYNNFYGETTEDTISKYNRHADHYNVYMGAAGFIEMSPKTMADKIVQEIGNSKNKKILDVAAGTGLVGERLRKAGFSGIIDGIDGSKGMLKEAKKTGVYNQLWCQFLKPDEPLEVDKNIYDVVTSCGGIAPLHLSPLIIPQMVKCLHVHGILIFTVRINLTEIVKACKVQLQILEKEGILEKISIDQVSYYKTEYKDIGTDALQYCYKKLK